MTLEQVKSAIKEIESLNLKTEDAYDNIVYILRGKLGKCPIFAFQLDPHPDLYYMRARILENVNDTYSTISEHSYNHSPKKVRLGRANLPEQQIFYIGRVRITSLAEVNIIENKMEEETVAYSLSRWRPNKTMKFAAIINPDTIDLMESEEVKGFLSFVKNTYESQKESENIGLVYLYKYFAEKFTEPITKEESHKYKLTCAFANLVYNFYDNVAGLMYQSVKFPQTYNLAVRKEFIDN